MNSVIYFKLLRYTTYYWNSIIFVGNELIINSHDWIPGNALKTWCYKSSFLFFSSLPNNNLLV